MELMYSIILSYEVGCALIAKELMANTHMISCEVMAAVVLVGDCNMLFIESAHVGVCVPAYDVSDYEDEKYVGYLSCNLNDAPYT